MHEIKVDSNRIQDEVAVIQEVIKKMKQYEKQISNVAEEVRNLGETFIPVADSLTKKGSELEKLNLKISFANKTLEQSVINYVKTEKRITETKFILEQFHKSTQSNDKDSDNADGIDTYEYSYSEDNIEVPIDTQFLDRQKCLEMAERIINEHGKDGKCNGMSKERIAKELYAHAVGYYSAENLKKWGIDGDFIQGISESGETADIGLGDGLDLHYNIIWYLSAMI